MLFELIEYNNTDSDDTFSDRAVITFVKPKEVLKFIKEDNFYGKLFAYDEDEYKTFINSAQNGYDEDEPELIFEVTADSNLKIEDLK